jgi:hypothetical protein
VNAHRRRTIRRLRAATLGVAACAALAAPAAADPPAANYPQALWAHKSGDTPADHSGASRAPVTPAPKIGDTPADYPGMPGAPAASGFADVAPTRAHEAGGFDWPSAAIGAAGAGLLLVVSMGAGSVLSRHRTRVAR